MATVSTDLAGLPAALEAELKRQLAPPSDWTPLLRGVAAACMAASRDAVEQSRSPAGMPFAPLKPSTLKRRRGARKPLVGRGAYGPSHVAYVTGRGVVWTNTHRAFPFHQAGTRHMAARRTVELGPALLDQLSGMAADFFARGGAA